MNENTIITVGISPSWDIACSARAFVWGRHQAIERQTMTPAGKALNVSRALDLLGRRSIAAGLWGREDLAMALGQLRATPLIEPKLTAVPGQTRRNITLIDTGRGREMHLRSPNPLAGPQNLRRLTRDLAAIVGEGVLCVFAGAVPDSVVDEFVRMVRSCRAKGARIVVDTSGAALRAAVEEGGLWMIKPNVEELAELVGRRIGDRPEAIGRAARSLTDRVELVVVSRGARGAMVVTQEFEVTQTAPKIRTVRHTVGCGDFLLAGFLDGYLSACARFDLGRPDRSAIRKGLGRGIRLASAHAAGRR
jgi:1-phosphofructokinase